MPSAEADRRPLDRAVARYVRREVYPYSEWNRRRLLESGLGPTDIRSGADLRRLPPVPLAAVGDGHDAVLQPDRHAIVHFGRLSLVARLLWAAGWGRHRALLAKVIEPRYRPVHWTMAGDVPVGASARDLDRLGRLGQQLFDVVGVARGEAVVAVGLAAGGTAAEELGRGAVRAGVAWLPLEMAAAATLPALRPAALAGPAAVVTDVLARSGSWPGLRRLVVTDGPLTASARAALTAPAPDAEVRVAWAPPGVRSLWVECGPDSGLHTTTGADIVDVEDGEIVWSPLGWAGTVVLRLRTGVHGTVSTGTCPVCGRTSARVHVEVADPPARQRRVLRAKRTPAAAGPVAPRRAPGRRSG